MTRFRVKEIFGPTIQGEGSHAGRACVFLRFAACNLACSWCDTDFAPEGAPFLTAPEIVGRLLDADTHQSRTVVVTGGEPALQWAPELATSIRGAGFRVHMETNGTVELAAPVDWLTVSPKPQFHTGAIALIAGDILRPSECKVVVDDSVDAAALLRYESHYSGSSGATSEGTSPLEWFVQPCDGDGYQASLARALDLVHARPRWKLSLQLHKIIDVP